MGLDLKINETRIKILTHTKDMPMVGRDVSVRRSHPNAYKKLKAEIVRTLPM